MMDLPFLTLVSVSIVALTLGEFLWSLYRGDGLYTCDGTLGNILRNVVTRGVQRFLDSVQMAFLLFGSFVLLRGNYPANGLSLLVSVLLIDVTYYFVHKVHHQLSFLWIFHSVHHGDNRYNLSTGMRVSWLQEVYFSILLILPAVLLGLPARSVGAALLIFALYQSFVHTAYIHFPRVLDSLLVTPHNHRIHHDQSLQHQCCNFGGIFSIWDRLFGTYKGDIKHFTPGIAGYHQDNFIKMETDPIVEYFLREKRSQ